ncbi:hypothetical protein EBQ34_10785 [Vandammella animalimorsus]|uniref:CDP-glycerol:poly(Glycerophosphate) glycerophosphotransferase n=1 Tax=Vandammella animalimorsus TaxID=2029117 RepID=A0A3M6R7E6_9BURK|nr:CDP-glycerol glycerophosphotransferase family protein [Vandammella animalimorsus]RMX11135.1 hypothetical protein EBQ34_10785 [Vandammella animalimorsus]
MSKDAFFSSLLREASQRRRKENIIAVVPEGGFRGNTKAAYLILSRLIQQQRLDWQVCWISSDRDKAMLSGLGMHSLSRDADRNQAADLYMRARYVLFGTHNFQDVDSWFWQSCRDGACKVQLWHGIPAKQVAYEMHEQMDNPYAFAGMASDSLSYDYCVIESPASWALYRKAFPSATFLPLGSPRNDLLVRDDYADLLLIGMEQAARERLEQARRHSRIALLCPTYREARYHRESFMRWLELAERIARHKHWSVTVKLHPFHEQLHPEDIAAFKQASQQHGNIVLASANDDIQPYLKLSDALISDYSSVVADYLITGKPVLYFRPDEAQYWATRKRPVQPAFPEDEIGPVFHEPQACLDWLVQGEHERYAERAAAHARRLHANYGTGSATESLLAFLLSRPQ